MNLSLSHKTDQKDTIIYNVYLCSISNVQYPVSFSISSSLVANFRNCWQSADTLSVHATELVNVLVPDDGGGPLVH